jgi:GNAT superfamily N-acetyltransferase
MIPYSIRTARPADVSALENLLQRSVRGLSEGYYTQRQIESALRYVFGVDTQLIADGTYFVAELAAEEGRIVGCGGWSKRRTLFGGDQMKSGADDLLDPATESARIRAFFIDPDFARRGVGRELIGACERAAREAGFRRFELGATLPGEPMYAKVGYTAIKRIDHLMPDGEILPIVHMQKQIEE